MAQRIVVDPITRIEGHLRIEVMVDENNVVQEAYSGSTLCWLYDSAHLWSLYLFSLQSWRRSSRKRPWNSNPTKC